MKPDKDSSTVEHNDLRLKACDPRCCEAMCCHDGVYLMEAEELFLRELVANVSTLRDILPPNFVVDGYWNGEYYGRKTAVRNHDYLNPNFPEHFPRTRCVFADAEGFCELEKLARAKSLDPWALKPATCWLFPLGLKDGEPLPPPVDANLDPYRSEGYPGYATVVPCGKHDPDGLPWRMVLERENDYLGRTRQLPVLGSEGNTVRDFLQVIGHAKEGKEDS